MTIKTVKEFYPELSPSEAELFLISYRHAQCTQRFEKIVSKYLSARLCRIPGLQFEEISKIVKCFGKEPIPFFFSTWELSMIPVTELESCINKVDIVSRKNNILRSFVSKLSSNLQQILLRAQLKFLEDNFMIQEENLEYKMIAQKLFEANREFCTEYPVAAYLAKGVSDSWFQYLKEILEHLTNDWMYLRHFGITDKSEVVDIKLGLGDSHFGRSVALVEFSDGMNVLYKPRSLKPESACREATVEIGKVLGIDCDFVCRVIDRGYYGWAEYIPHDAKAKFRNPRAIAEFACLLKLLNFSDVHYENVRFSSSGVPTLVDAETVLSAGLHAVKDSITACHSALSSCITSTGLFPSPLVIAKKKRETFVDVGVLGRRDSNAVYDRQLVIKYPFTAKMHVTYEDVAKYISADYFEYPINDKFVRGLIKHYSKVLTRAIECKQEISTIVNRTFKDVPIRVVLQDTIKYSNAITLATNQECLQSASYYVAALMRSYLRRKDIDERIVAYEYESLIENNIPRFEVLAASKSLCGANTSIVQDYFCESPLEITLENISNLSEDCVKTDCWLVKVSFAPYYSEKNNHTDFNFTTKAKKEHGKVLQTTINALSDLMQGYVPSSNSLPPTWLGARLSTHSHQYWYVDELGFDIYAGSTGVALPLLIAHRNGISAKGAVHGEIYFEQLLSRLECSNIKELTSRSSGAISGIHSVMWALDCYAQITGNNEARTRIRDLSLLTFETAFNSYDYLSGLSGIALLALNLGIFNESNLLTGYLESLHSIVQEEIPFRMLSGYAHGLAGLLGVASLIATKYPKLAQLEFLVDRLFLKLIKMQDKSSGLWPIGAGNEKAGRGWCSGSPGVLLALAQLFSSPYGNNYNLNSLIQRLIEDTRQNAIGGNPTLCHGDVGNLWILEHVGKLIKNAELVSNTRNAGMTWLNHIFPQYVNSLSRSAVSHGLFAGIGGACLYAEHLLLENTIVRSPLWLE